MIQRLCGTTPGRDPKGPEGTLAERKAGLAKAISDAETELAGLTAKGWRVTGPEQHRAAALRSTLTELRAHPLGASVEELIDRVAADDSTLDAVLDRLAKASGFISAAQISIPASVGHTIAGATQGLGAAVAGASPKGSVGQAWGQRVEKNASDARDALDRATQGPRDAATRFAGQSLVRAYEAACVLQEMPAAELQRASKGLSDGQRDTLAKVLKRLP